MALAKKEVRLQQIREKMATLGARSDPCVHSATATEQPTTANKAASSSAGTSPEGGQSPLATRAAIPTTAAPAAEHAPAECTVSPATAQVFHPPKVKGFSSRRRKSLPIGCPVREVIHAVILLSPLCFTGAAPCRRVVRADAYLGYHEDTCRGLRGGH